MRTNIGIVNCDLHGVLNIANKIKEVKVTLGDSKRSRLTGCPHCRRDDKRIRAIEQRAGGTKP